ncbi:MAG: methylated-DNA--[protein]-cysteine S-methyltransferase [Muribaculaceae bacterium]|nr:methylated-DNA--[protein]-cysteine S-methyltransferase [Muribaculaceae bacterium]
MDGCRRIKVKEYVADCGTLVLGEYEGKLCLCDWLTEKHHENVKRRLKRILKAEFEEDLTGMTIEKATRQLDEYFAGRRKTFDIPLLFVGTDFQRRVWGELLKIEYGTTISYRTLAHRIGMPMAVRAVANAAGANSISIFAPCHRVVGSDRSLTGYGGGLDVKKALLQLESPLLFKD